MFVWGHGEIMGLKAKQSQLLSLGLACVHVDYCDSIFDTIECDFAVNLAPQYTAHKCQILNEREVRYWPKEAKRGLNIGELALFFEKYSCLSVSECVKKEKQIRGDPPKN